LLRTISRLDLHLTNLKISLMKNHTDQLIAKCQLFWKPKMGILQEEHVDLELIKLSTGEYILLIF